MKIILTIIIIMQTSFADSRLSTTAKIHSKVQYLKYMLVKNNYGQSEAEALVKLALEDLVATGVKQKDIINYIKSGLKDSQLKNDFDNLLKTIKIQKLDKGQTMILIADFLKHSDYQGTSYWQRGDWKYFAAINLGVLLVLPFLMYGVYDVASH